MKKFFLWLFIILVLAIIGWFVFKWYTARGVELNTFSLIPSDAIYVIETNQPVNSWKDISSTETWKHLQGNTWFASLTSATNSLDSMLQENSKLFDIIGNRSVLVSAHMISSSNYDFLIVADLGDAAGVKFLETYLSSLEYKGYVFSKEQFGETEGIKIVSKADGGSMHLCLYERYLLFSLNKSLIHRSLESRTDKNLAAHPLMEKATASVGTNGIARIYLNYEMLNAYTSIYTGQNEYVKYISENMRFGSMQMDQKNELFSLAGKVWLKDSAVSYFSALAQSGNGPRECMEVAPQRTAFYFGLGFSSFPDFYSKLQENLKKDVADYTEYMDNVRKTEKFLNISVQEDFVSWIDDEIALLEITSAGKGLDNEVALILKAGNIEKAKDRLEHIEKMVKRRTPVKFKAVDYKGYRISYLSVKGLFKAVLGKFFARYDKPYYTVLNNFVIFSNHPQALESIIDDYLEKNTLARSAELKEFQHSWNNESSVLVYINTPSLFSGMKNIANASTKSSMDSNKQYIECFKHVAFQLKSNGEGFDALLCEQFVKPQISMVQTPDSLLTFEDTLNQYFQLPYIYVKNPNEKSYKQFADDSTTLQFEVELKYGFKDGDFVEYHPNGEVKLKGKFKKDKRVGTWKAYDAEGELIGKREYE